MEIYILLSIRQVSMDVQASNYPFTMARQRPQPYANRSVGIDPIQEFCSRSVDLKNANALHRCLTMR